MSKEKTTKPSRRKRLVVRPEAVTVHIVTAGQTLSERYHLVREVARGGMGVVFEAEDIELENRRVAVKVLPPELSHSAKAKKRLKKEAIAAMELTHQNILRLHGFEQDEEVAYLVMEYLAGETLDEALAEEEALSLERVLAIAKDVCPALEYAHSKGVIHRDIKPANLMYESENEGSAVKLTDFGIAYVVKDSMTRLTGLESAGTLLYVSPEQLRNDPPSPQSDQYSLAATLYELLDGDPPFTGAGLAHKILEAKARPIEDVPDYVNSALLKALSKNPDERFASCEEFLQALKEVPALLPEEKEEEVATPPRPEPQPQPEPEPTPPIETKPKPSLEDKREEKEEVAKPPQPPPSSKWDWVFRFYALLYAICTFAFFASVYHYFEGGFFSDDKLAFCLAPSAMVMGPAFIYLISAARGVIDFSAKTLGLVVYLPITVQLAVAIPIAYLSMIVTGSGVDNPLFVLLFVPLFSYLHIKVLTYIINRLEPPKTAPPSIGWLTLVSVYSLLLGFFCAFFVYATHRYGHSSLGHEDTMTALAFTYLAILLPFGYYFRQCLSKSNALSMKTTFCLLALPMVLVGTSAIVAEVYRAIGFDALNDGHVLLFSTLLFAYPALTLTSIALSFEMPKKPVTSRQTWLGLIHCLVSAVGASSLFYCIYRHFHGRFRSDEEILTAIGLSILIIVPFVYNIYRAKREKTSITMGLIARSVLLQPLVISVIAYILVGINYETFRFDFDDMAIFGTGPFLAFLIALLHPYVFPKLD